MNVLVTGANGFIGKHLVKRLLSEGRNVVCTTRENGDVGEPALLAELVARARPDCVIHLAGVTASSDRSSFYTTNVIGTENLLAALSTLPGRPHVLLASTAAVYGGQVVEYLEETHPVRPTNHYGVSKLAMEQVAWQFNDRLAIRVLRLFNVIGSGQAPAYLVPKLVNHFVGKLPELSLGNTKPLRDYVDVEDVVAAIGELSAMPPAAFDIVNICSGVGVSVDGVLEVLAGITGHRPDLKTDPHLIRRNEIWRSVGSNSKLRGLLPGHSFKPIGDTLLRMTELRSS